MHMWVETLRRLRFWVRFDFRKPQIEIEIHLKRGPNRSKIRSTFEFWLYRHVYQKERKRNTFGHDFIEQIYRVAIALHRRSSRTKLNCIPYQRASAESSFEVVAFAKTRLEIASILQTTADVLRTPLWPQESSHCDSRNLQMCKKYCSTKF